MEKQEYENVSFSLTQATSLIHVLLSAHAMSTATSVRARSSARRPRFACALGDSNRRRTRPRINRAAYV